MTHRHYRNKGYHQDNGYEVPFQLTKLLGGKLLKTSEVWVAKVLVELASDFAGLSSKKLHGCRL
jgi:hypothetical protein